MVRRRDRREPIHLRPTAPLAERVLLPGRPPPGAGRGPGAARRAADVQPRARAVGLHRARAADGEPLTVQATGMGGPERGDRGRGADRPRRARRWCGSGPAARWSTGLELGDAGQRRARCWPPTAPAARSAPAARCAPDPELAAALRGAGAPAGDAPCPPTSSTTRARRRRRVGRRPAPRWWRWRRPTLLAVAERRGRAAAVLLAVTDLLGGGERAADRRARSSRQLGVRPGRGRPTRRWPRSSRR